MLRGIHTPILVLALSSLHQRPGFCRCCRLGLRDHCPNLLPVIRQTGLDGVNGLTPGPVGDIGFEETLDRCGEDFIIFGGVFPPEIFHRPGVTRQEIEDALERLFSPRIRRANFVLWVAVDGLSTPPEKFQIVRDWMARRQAV